MSSKTTKPKGEKRKSPEEKLAAMMAELQEEADQRSPDGGDFKLKKTHIATLFAQDDEVSSEVLNLIHDKVKEAKGPGKLTPTVRLAILQAIVGKRQKTKPKKEAKRKRQKTKAKEEEAKEDVVEEDTYAYHTFKTGKTLAQVGDTIATALLVMYGIVDTPKELGETHAREWPTMVAFCRGGDDQSGLPKKEKAELRNKRAAAFLLSRFGSLSEEAIVDPASVLSALKHAKKSDYPDFLEVVSTHMKVNPLQVPYLKGAPLFSLSK
jgi:hypothetical protein